jgi:hypothetical protein
MRYTRQDFYAGALNLVLVVTVVALTRLWERGWSDWSVFVMALAAAAVMTFVQRRWIRSDSQ